MSPGKAAADLGIQMAEEAAAWKEPTIENAVKYFDANHASRGVGTQYEGSVVYATFIGRTLELMLRSLVEP